MKKGIAIVIALTVVLIIPNIATSTIVDLPDINGKGYFQDLSTGYYWMDVDNFVSLDSIGVISALTPGFHLADQTELSVLFASAGPSTASTFDNLFEIMGGFYDYYTSVDYYERSIWGRTADPKAPNGHLTAGTIAQFYDTTDALKNIWDWNFDGYSDVVFQGNGAWAVSSERPVPEPTTILLLGSGLLGLARFRRKFKK